MSNHRKEEEVLIKLQGTVEGPKSDEEQHLLNEERFKKLIENDEPQWFLIREIDYNEPFPTISVWDYKDPKRKDEILMVQKSEFPGLYEGIKGRNGEIGSGLVDLVTAVEFVETN